MVLSLAAAISRADVTVSTPVSHFFNKVKALVSRVGFCSAPWAFESKGYLVSGQKVKKLSQLLSLNQGYHKAVADINTNPPQKRNQVHISNSYFG